jgi:hypothetical protein
MFDSTNNIQFYGNSLSPIMVIGRCKHDFSKTFEGAKRVLWQSMCRWSCNRWQITMNGAYHYFQVGFGCSTRIIESDNEVQCNSSNGRGINVVNPLDSQSPCPVVEGC